MVIDLCGIEWHYVALIMEGGKEDCAGLFRRATEGLNTTFLSSSSFMSSLSTELVSGGS